ncbi:hypothetical protein BST61_g660 [Cercospora zeina]
MFHVLIVFLAPDNNFLIRNKTFQKATLGFVKIVSSQCATKSKPSTSTNSNIERRSTFALKDVLRRNHAVRTARAPT